MQTLHLTHDVGRFILFGRSLVDGDGIACRIIRPEFLLLAGQVILNHSIRRCKDVLRRAIILLEQDHGCLWIVTLKVQDIPHIRAAPAVDGLIRIADHADIMVTLGKQLGDSILRAVRILILVHENVLKLILILCSYFFIV